MRRNFNSRSGDVTGGIAVFALFSWIVIFILVALGWIFNIVALIGTSFDAGLTVESALRIVGIFFVPLGAIMGLFV